MSSNETGKAIYMDFLPKALREGTYVAALGPEIIGDGPENIQKACTRQNREREAGKLLFLYNVKDH